GEARHSHRPRADAPSSPVVGALPARFRQLVGTKRADNPYRMPACFEARSQGDQRFDLPAQHAWVDRSETDPHLPPTRSPMRPDRTSRARPIATQSQKVKNRASMVAASAAAGEAPKPARITDMLASTTPMPPGSMDSPPSVPEEFNAKTPPSAGIWIPSAQ